MNSIAQQITVLNNPINCVDGLFSLNDLHKASGNKSKHKPTNFLRLDTTKSLVIEIEEENLNFSDVSNKKIALKSMSGRFGGTYACKELVYAYAMWISAKFHLAVIRVFDPSKLSRGDILRIALDAEDLQQFGRVTFQAQPFNIDDSGLTKNKNSNNICSVTAKSVTEIEPSNFTGVSTPLLMCFFYAQNKLRFDTSFICYLYMVGCIRHLSRWRFPVSRRFNLVQSAANKIEPLGGSYPTFTGSYNV